MIFYFLDNNDNIEAVINTESESGVVVTNATHTYGLVNRTRLSLINLTVKKNSVEGRKIKRGQRVLFRNARGFLSCVTLMANNDEDKNEASYVGEDLAMQLLNSSAKSFESQFEQYIDYYVNRDLWNTGWEIGVNEIGTDLKRKLELKDESVLGRLQTLCSLFSCEMSFRIEVQNTRVVKNYIDIRRKIGNDRSDRVLYSGVDVISIQKSEDQYNVKTAVRDTNNGFDDYEFSDGQFFSRKGESIIYDRLADAEYGSGNTKMNRPYIIGNMSSTKNTQVANFAEALAYLKEHNQHDFSAEVDVLFDDSDFEIGDYVTFVDEDFGPAIRLRARILQKEIDLISKRNNKLILGNYSLLDSRISSDLIALQNQIRNSKENILTYETLTDIADDKVTVSVKVFLNGKDITATMEPKQFFWQKYDKLGNLIDWQPLVNGSSIVDDYLSIDATNNYSVKFFTNDYKYVHTRVFLDGLTEVASKVMRLQTPDTINLIHTADLHKATDTVIYEDLTNQMENEKHALNAVELTHYIPHDALIVNGDISDGGTASKEIARSDLQVMASSIIQAACPSFMTVGNHDQNSWGDSRVVGLNKVAKQYKATKSNRYIHGNLQQQLMPDEMYKLVTEPSKAFNIKENPIDKNGYYYYDVPGKKFRLFFLNPFDVPNVLDTDGFSKYYILTVAGYREKQIKWFAEALKSTPSDYHVGLFQHFPFGERHSKTMEYYPYNYELIDGIIDAYVNGKSFSGSYSANPDFKASVSVNYAQKGVIAFMMCGHFHNDRLVYDSNGIPHVMIMCSVSRPIANRPLGSINEDAFDSIVINKEKRHVDLIRFGYGSDRSFNY